MSLQCNKKQNNDVVVLFRLSVSFDSEQACTVMGSCSHVYCQMHLTFTIICFALFSQNVIFVFPLGLTDHQRASHVDLSFPPSCPALLHHQEHRAFPRLWNISNQNLELQQKPQCTCFLFIHLSIEMSVQVIRS